MSDPLRRWLNKLEVFDQTDDQPLADRDEMLAIARELGLGDEAIAKAKAEADAAQIRGLNFLEHGRSQDAVIELKQALALAPWRFDLLAALAEAHTAAFEQTGADREAAEHIVRRVLQARPKHLPAYALLNRLDQPPDPKVTYIHKIWRAPLQSQQALILGGVALLIFISAVLTLLLNAPEPAPAASSLTMAEPAIAPPRTSKLAVIASPAANDSRQLKGKHALPVTVVTTDAVTDLVFDGLDSYIKHGRHDTYAALRMHVKNESSDLISELEGMAVFLDDAGAEVARKEMAIINTARPKLRPGDHIFARLYARDLPWNTSRVELRFEQVRRGAGGGPWPPLKPVCLQYIDETPVNPAIAVRLRSAGERGIFWRVEGEVENISQRALTDVQLEARFLDSEGQSVVNSRNSDNETIADRHLPLFKPGEVRLFHIGRHMSQAERDQMERICLIIKRAE